MVALVIVLAYQVVYGILLTFYAPVWIGHDFRLYTRAALEWLATGTFYHPAQLTGPYAVVDSEILYPPVALLLFVPFALLPAWLWWVIPIGVTVGLIASHRPGPWRIAAMLGLLALPPEFGTSYSLSSIAGGNPVIWVVMFVALATRWPVFGPFVLLKFTLLPFALVGYGPRAWGVGAAVFGLLCLAFAPMWPDYLTAILNARPDTPPILYSLRQVPLVAIPLVGYAAAPSENAR